MFSKGEILKIRFVSKIKYSTSKYKIYYLPLTKTMKKRLSRKIQQMWKRSRAYTASRHQSNPWISRRNLYMTTWSKKRRRMLAFLYVTQHKPPFSHQPRKGTYRLNLARYRLEVFRTMPLCRGSTSATRLWQRQRRIRIQTTSLKILPTKWHPAKLHMLLGLVVYGIRCRPSNRAAGRIIPGKGWHPTCSTQLTATNNCPSHALQWRLNQPLIKYQGVLNLIISREICFRPVIGPLRKIIMRR